MDEPAFPGCLLKCRVVGVIEGVQGKKKKAERNDRIVAVEEENHSYAYVKHVDGLGKKFVRELEEFFVNYHKILGKTYPIISVKRPGGARRSIQDGMRADARKYELAR
jgi:inorganic pyrophosphatase